MIVTVSGPVTKRCPVVEEVDEGRISLAFEVPVGEMAAELHDFAEHLRKFRNEPISHEHFTQLLFDRWSDAGCVRVVTTWQTAGLEVRCVVPGEPDQLDGGA